MSILAVLPETPLNWSRRSDTKSSAVTAEPVWHEINPGMWVGRITGDIVATIEHVDSYILTNARGDVLGSHNTLSAAQNVMRTSPTYPGSGHRYQRTISRHRITRLALIASLPRAGIAILLVILAQAVIS